MIDTTPKIETREAAEQFLAAVPPIWYSLRSQIDKIARQKFGITGGQYHVLRRIKSGMTSISELAQVRHISLPTVSRKVEHLVEKGLVARRESQKDRRCTILELTEAGEEIIQEMEFSRRKWLEEQFSVLDDQELETIIQALSLMTALSQKGSEGI
jgi:DNA-binding MarR family transcriptional regulator